MIYLLYTVHVLLCLFLILVVLLQQGKGADLSVFGGGSTMTAFGARSATTLLHRLTVVAFVGFVLTTLSIAYMQANVQGASVLSGAARTGVQQIPPDEPAAPAPTAPAQAAPATPAPTAPTSDAPPPAEAAGSGAAPPPSN